MSKVAIYTLSMYLLSVFHRPMECLYCPSRYYHHGNQNTSLVFRVKTTIIPYVAFPHCPRSHAINAESTFLKKMKPLPILNDCVRQTHNNYRRNIAESLFCLYFSLNDLGSGKLFLSFVFFHQLKLLSL